jgi:hypothetical protein
VQDHIYLVLVAGGNSIGLGRTTVVDAITLI